MNLKTHQHSHLLPTKSCSHFHISPDFGYKSSVYSLGEETELLSENIAEPATFTLDLAVIQAAIHDKHTLSESYFICPTVIKYQPYSTEHRDLQ